MEYLIRFIQTHETFRKPETDALAELAGLDVDWLFYSEEVCLINNVLG
jgi:tRNA (guanine10-N2)-methyltransferase